MPCIVALEENVDQSRENTNNVPSHHAERDWVGRLEAPAFAGLFGRRLAFGLDAGVFGLTALKCSCALAACCCQSFAAV